MVFVIDPLAFYHDFFCLTITFLEPQKERKKERKKKSTASLSSLFWFLKLDQVMLLTSWSHLLQLSFGPIGWLMISEIFPLRVRGRGLSITVLVNFGANALVAFAFSPLQVLKTFNTLNFLNNTFCVYSVKEFP